MKKKPPGLYANIQAKRARGEKMRKPGEEGAPSASDFKNAAKTAKKKKGVKREDPKGNPAGYFDKEGCKTCAGGKKPCKCSKKDMVVRKSSYADGFGKKCDSIAADFNAVMDTEAREDKPCGASFIPQNAKCTKGSKGAGQAKKAEAKQQAQAKYSQMEKQKAIRKIAAERFKGVKSERLKASIKKGKGHKSLEGRTVQKAAKREMFNRKAKTALQGAVLGYGPALYMESRRNQKRS